MSATPYLYSLRFYDWLRRDEDGRQRPVHVELAFRNLDRERRGNQVAADLVAVLRPQRSGPGWREDVLADLPEMFFDVRRLELEPDSQLDDDTAGRFQVLTVVEGAGVAIVTAAGSQVLLAYAETAVVPAAVGAYTVAACGRERVRVVKAQVR